MSNNRSKENEQTAAQGAETISAGTAPSAGVLIDPKGLQELIASSVAAATATISASQQKQSTEQIQAIVNALLESRKPYVDPKHLENERMIREKDAEAARKRDEAIKESQRTCPHFQGSNPLSEQQGSLSSIAKHRLDTGELIGICTNCLRVFRAGDEDYAMQMTRKSGNRPSGAGQRYLTVRS